ncbi:MAG: hypothetical protein BKP49_09065 [Treponema sp. CETP13]|nr:MAG: hypothetical protein BKP49_09065 [Treponema sp. CETP13]
MTIAIFTDTFYPMVNGVVTAILNIAEPFADKGHKVIIVTPNIKSKETYSYPGIIVKKIKSLPAGFYEDFRWTPPNSYSTYKLLKNEKVDIVHFTSPWTTCYLGIKLARALNIPVIGTFHTYISDPSYYEHALKGIIKISEKTPWNYINMYYNKADFITAPSQYTLNDMHENGCNVKGKVISNGIDSKIFDNSNWKDFKEKYQLGNNTVLFFGRIAQEKNLPVLIDGFTKAWEKEKDLQLLIIGEGPLRKSFQKKLRTEPVNKNIIFTGAIPHEDLVKSGVFKACWLCATASKTENQPMTILEAQVNGMVCIGANAKGIPDLIVNNENGLLFSADNSNEISDAILKLYHDDKLYTKFKKNTLELIKKHDITNITLAWEDCYSKVIENYQKGLYEKKDYLHTREILSIFKEFKFDYKALLHKKT